MHWLACCDGVRCLKPRRRIQKKFRSLSVTHNSDISPGISETKFMVSDTSFVQWKLSLKNLSEFLFPSRLDWLRYFAGGICILLAKVNKFCWLGRIFVSYYCIESNITMQPTPSFPRSIPTIIEVSGTNATLALCRWSASTLRCRSYPNLKEFK